MCEIVRWRKIKNGYSIMDLAVEVTRVVWGTKASKSARDYFRVNGRGSDCVANE